MNISSTYPPYMDTKNAILSLIRKLVKDNSTTKEFRIPPSMFMEEMKLTTEERLEQLRNSTYKPKIMPTSKNQIFIPIPEVIVFQNYKPGVVYTTSFAMRNNSTVPKPLRVVLPLSPYFTVTYASESISTHIAPGIAILFNVRFSADDLNDYKYDTSFITEDETITFTIYALRPRPLLELPDEIILPTTAVRVPTEKCVFVRNLGEAPANFLTSTNPPFSINIENGILLPNDLMKLTVCFDSTLLGTVHDYLNISFDTGEILSIKLKCQTENASINFEKGALHFHKTFISLKRKRNVVLFNNSKYNVKFRWKLYGTEAEENAKLDKIKNSLKRMKSNETLKSNKLADLHIIDKEGHTTVYERIYKDELQEMGMQNQYPYQNQYFKIVPMSGDVFAKSRFEFTIFFTPTYVGTYNTRGFLDVTGLDTRIPLIINGCGIGPYIELNMESLDANKLYMCAVHQYEVVAINKGDIPGTITFPNQKLEFGGVLSCDPSSHSLQPNECGRFNLKFSSKQQGNFFEEVIFTIEESTENLRLIFMGEIICPYLTFDVSEIAYGIVPIGYPRLKKLTLHNASMVPIEFKFFVYGDGDVPSLTCKEYASLPIKCGLPKQPKEFDYSLRFGSVLPHSSLLIELTLTANIVRQVQTSLMLKMWESDRHTISIPLSYKAQTPRVVCLPPEVNIRFCYITYPYYRNITLRNESDLPGYFELNLSGSSQMKGLQCSISKSNIFIKPNEDVEIHMVVKTNYLGDDRIPIFMSLLGGKPFQCCSVICRGQGPVIGVSAEDLEFGKIKMLTEATEEIKITNDSPIVASVTISLSPNSSFKVTPTEITLQLEQSVIVTVSICLYDPITVQGTLTISADQGNEVTCTLRAKGYGTSIECVPILEPELNVGLLLTYQDFRFPVTFTNRGIREHKIMWTRNKQVKLLKEGLLQATSAFTFRPSLLEMSAQEKMITVIKGYSTKLGFVNEDYYCHASINNSNAIDIIMSFNITATFVEPRMEISKKEIKFVQNFSSDICYEFTRDDIVITNISQVTLSLKVITEEPFFVEQHGDNVLCLNLSLKHGESHQMFINFRPSDDQSRLYVVKSKLKLDYLNHPKNDFVNLMAEVNFPTIEIIPRLINFPCQPPMAICYAELMIKNVSPLVTKYHFEWQEDSFCVEKIEENAIVIPKKKTAVIESLGDADDVLDAEMEINEEEVTDSSRTEVVLQIVDFKRSANHGGITRLPVVYYFHFAFQEVYQKYHYIQYRDVLDPSISMDGLVMLPKRNLECFMQMRSFLYPVINDFSQSRTNNDIFKMLPKDVSRPHLNKTVLDITPTHGVLKPFECQSVAVCFRPIPNALVMAEVVCHIDGGSSEFINIEGKSCQLSFTIETVQVDFGRQIFCEVTEKTINLKNVSLMPFSFSTSAKDLPKFIPSTLVLEAGGLTVTPKQAELQPGESTKLHIQYLPGIAGEFNETFTIKVGYLPEIQINVHGYGDFPQVYLGERPSIDLLPHAITYWAIATITAQYLKSLKNINYILRFVRNMGYQEDLSKCACASLKRQGWVVISYQDLCPSVMDIDLAIERMILYNFIFDNPQVLSKHLKVHKEMPVPEFSVPEYVVDLGYVIVGDKTMQKIRIFNYGPTNTRVKVLTSVDKRLVLGLDIESMRSANIEVGQTKEFNVSFYPTREAYRKEPDKTIDYCIFLDVAHGPRIPICIHADVTVPKLHPNTLLLNFGEVRCGNLKKRSLILVNNGFVQSNWSAIVQKKEAKRFSRTDVDAAFVKKVFYLIINENTVRPGGKCKLDVYFEPQAEGSVEWELIITIDKNPKKIEIVVKGLGRMPDLKITNEIVEFKPVLPYSPLCEKTFRIQNACALPIEFYFSDFDMDIDMEEKVLNLLYDFYTTNQLILPPRKPGSKLPPQLVTFYQIMTENLNRKLIKISMNQVENKHLNSLEESVITLCSGRRRSSSKRKSISARSGISIDGNYLDVTTSLLPKDLGELEVLLRDHVRELQPEEKSKYNPIGDIIAEYKELFEKKDLPLINEGVYIIFHGCSHTNYLRAAYKSGLELNVPVCTIDELILHSLVKPQDSNTRKIKDTITKEYLKLVPDNPKLVKLPKDSLQELEQQVEFLLQATSFNLATVDKKEIKKDKKQVDKNIFLGISEELILDLLKVKLASFHTGVIIESLYSRFVFEPFVALQIILKAIGNVKYLHCIILSYSYEQYSAFLEDIKFQQEEDAIKKREQKLECMIEMEPEQLKMLLPEDYHVFINEFLNKRREITSRRRENLKKRLLELRLKRARPKSKKSGKKQETAKAKAADTKKDVSKQSTKCSTLETFKEPKVKDEKTILKFEKFGEQLVMILHLLENWDRKSLICTKALTTPLNGKASKNTKSLKSVTPPSKIPSRFSFAKPPVEYKNLTPDQELKLVQNGIPCWVIDNAHIHKPVEEMVALYLHHTPDFKMASLSLQESIKENVEETIELRTVVYASKNLRNKNTSNIFVLKNVVEDLPVQNTTSKAKESEHGKNVSSKKRNKNALDDSESDKLTPRMVLSAGGRARYRVLFKPEVIGNYEHTFTLQIIGWPTKFYVTCQGKADIPKLNMTPEVVFPKVIKKRTKKTQYHNNIFLSDLNIFDFGPVLSINKIDPKILASETEFNFKNTSLIPCVTSFCIYKNPNAFEFDKEEITIAPGVTEILNMRALPIQAFEVSEDQLIISIKDNPAISIINLKSQSCKLTFALTPKLVRFDRILVNSVKEEHVTFHNKSLVPICWELANLEKLLNYFRVLPTSGCVEPEDKQKVVVQFYSEVPKNILKQPFIVELYDKDYRNIMPIQTESIDITAEAMLVPITCETDLDLGEVKGQTDNQRSYLMTTKGKYNVEFSFTSVTKADDPQFKEHKTLRSYFKIVPLTGVMVPLKSFDAELKYFCKTPLIAKKVPLFNVKFTDPLRKTLIRTFTLTVTFRTKFATYELSPPEEINFGYQLIGSDSFQTVTLANHGDFEFEYTIANLAPPVLPKSNKSKESGKDSKKSKSETDDRKKGNKPVKLDFGCFSLTPLTGVVEAKSNVIIEVLSKPTHLGVYKETLVFYITQTQEPDIHGRHFNFSVHSMLPAINFSNVSGIFRKQFVVTNMAAIDKNMLNDENAIFIKEETKLYFPRKIINKQAKAQLILENTGPVPAELSATTASPDNVFLVEPKLFNVEPYSETQVTISFIPNSINVFNGTATITYRGLDSHKPAVFQMKICGEGIVPQISLIKPEYDESLDCHSLRFSPTFVNIPSTQSIVFENTGVLPCTVIFEMSEGTLDVFRLKPHPDSKKFVSIQEEVPKTTAHTNAVNLDIGENAEFYLEFVPTSPNSFSCLIKLHTINNPYEMITIYVTGEGYDEDILLQDLETYPIKSDNLNNTCSTGYFIDFGEVFVGNHKTKCFKLINVSLNDIYKFEFTPTNKIFFMPERGHLKPKACKEVLVTFLSKEPLTINKVQLECALYKITYVNSQLEALSWDDRQTVVVWEPTEFFNLPSLNTTMTGSSTFLDNTADVSSQALKSIKDKEEPLIEIVPNTTRYILLLVSAVCNYASYKCQVKHIEIQDTFAFEHRSETFEVTNTSNISYVLEWNVALDEAYSAKEETKISVINNSEDVERVKAFRRTLRRPIQLTGKEKIIEDESSSINSSMFSAEGDIINLGDDPYVNDVVPFEVTPCQVIMEPMETKTFTLTFAPKDIFNYLADVTAKIHCLNPEQKNLVITAKSRSLLPLYYLDIPDSDYVSLRRKTPIVCNDLVNENMAVVEFEAIGLMNNITRCFNILNPTSNSFTYKWEVKSANLNEFTPFHCHRPEGKIEKGKMTEAIFTFIPRSVGTFEALYTFTIEKHNRAKTCLMVGIAREPLVYFSKAFIQIRPSVLALDINEYTLLKNTEDFEVDFKFRKESLYSDAHHQSLTIEPMKGVLAPNGERQIKITYHPVKAGEVEFNLQCVVTKMKKPITLNVNAVCYEIKPLVYYNVVDETKVILNTNKVNTMELNSLTPLYQKDVIFTISNVGQTSFYYTWCVNEGLLKTKVELRFSESEGFIAVGQEAHSKMSLTLLTKVVIKKLVIKLQIRYGPTYIIHLSGTVATTLYDFSFSEYDFGYCLVQEKTTSYYKVVLAFTNSDESPVTLECKCPLEDCLTVKFNSKRIQSKAVEAIDIYFHPFKVQQYNTDVLFYVNSQPQTICFKGEGVPITVRLKNCNDKFLNLGSVPAGKSNSISVAVLNDGLSSIEIIFDIPDRLPICSKPKNLMPADYKSLEHVTKASSQNVGEKENNDKNKNNGARHSLKDRNSLNTGSVKTVTAEELEQQLVLKSISVTPKKFVKVATQQSTQFVITFSPSERMKTFSGKIAYQVQDITEVLCIFKGCSVGPDYVLDKQCIPFGSVILGYSNKQKVMLNNVGDIGGTFKWTFEKSRANFTITPDSGYICSHSTILFTVQFKPSSLRNLFQEKLKCQISNFMKTLELELSGSCVNMPPAVDEIHFKCAVRELDSKTILIENSSSETRKVSTTMNGQYFFSTETFTILPKSSLNCEVFYKPLRMTGENPHKATIFFAFPEGQGLLYHLEGVTKPPLVVKKFSREIRSKIMHNEILEVQNWLKTPQTFNVQTENILTGKVLYKITSNDTIEVLGSSKRDYTWSIYALNEGVLHLKVTFKNKETKEYLFYEISLNITKSPSLSVVTLSTCLRRPITHSLTLENHLKYPVTFTIKPSVPELSYNSVQAVEAFSQHEFVITYKPTTVGETDAHVDIVSTDLGTYPYDFKLIAKPPMPETILTFHAKLGQAVAQKTQMTNTFRSAVTFEANCAHPQIFYLDGTLVIAADATKEFSINFEPTEIGTITSSLSLSSPQTGTYIYTLKGKCELPQPQGPFFIVPGNNVTITFKNPFNEATEFRFAAEPAIFSVKCNLQSLKARSDIKVSVYLVPIQNLEILIDRKYAITGRLTVQPTKLDFSHIKWVYYLHGDLNY